MARRMLTIREMYDKLKSYFVDKTSANEQDLVGPLATLNGTNKLIFKNLGTLNGTDILYNKGLTENGIYFAKDENGVNVIIFATFTSDGNGIIGGSVSNNYFSNFSKSKNLLTLQDAKASAYYNTAIYFASVTSINANLGGTPVYGIENSTIHIRGTFTPTATIAAGSKLFSTVAISAKMTHGSAINTGTTGSETFIGISIQTNGDVYCLGALTSGVTYSIAVTATL